MRLFTLLHNAVELGDTDSLWEIVLRFEPLINSKCKNVYSSMIDDDLKSEMQIKLIGRISKYRIFM